MTPSTDHPTADAVLRAIALDDERGGSVLVSGGTSAQRRDRIESVLNASRAGDTPPLIVRVSAPAGSSLAEMLGAAAETELTRMHAPGGLYDDPSGGALASLGGWLFRARAVRSRGVLFAIDDVDAWLDVRGSSGDGSHALRVVRSLISECSRRPVSVIASVRASDASGDPALPEELASSFGHVVRLGGAKTVTRDPMTLVTHLSGRSFTADALKHAVVGWLELPASGDETVVTFSSPLAPPALSIEPANAELAFHRSASDATSESPDVATSVTPPLGEGWSHAVRAAIEVREILRTIGSVEGHHGAKQWERMFCDGAARLPSALAVLARGERALGIEATRVGDRGREVWGRFDAAFRDYYANAHDAWLAGTTRPTMLCDLPARLSRVATEKGARGTSFVLVTGLRVDAWQRWRQRVMPRVAGLSLLEEGVHWAARPATSQMQRELLARGASAMGAAIPSRDEPPAPRNMDEAVKPRREHIGHHEVQRIDAYLLDASQPAEPNDGLTTNWERIERALAPVLLSLCGSFPGKTALLIAGDAGLRENDIKTAERAAPRGVMGGDSAFEVLVPYSLWMWG